MTRNVLAWLEEAAARWPDAIAVEDPHSALTYAQLRRQARAIGSYVAQTVPAQSPVLLLMDKTPQAVAAMLGCVYAGCFYTPVDAAMPQTRLLRIVRRLEPACVLYASDMAELAGALGCAAHAVEEAMGEPPEEALLQSRLQAQIDCDLLYVLFTSGSTGEPKGVAITHRSVIDFVEWAVDALRIPVGCSFGNQAPLYFDNSVLDVYGALRTGSRVFLLPRADFAFPKRLLRDLRERGIDTIFWVPSALTSVAASGVLSAEAPALQRVFFCGETMPCKTLNAWHAAVPQADFVNMYGPTEITDVCTWYRVNRDFADEDALPIGKPCANTRVLLVDGEICVTGTCLAAGYYGDPERTAEAFVQNPRRGGVPERMYRTGDLGAYNDRGELLFLGRRDQQIKRSGYRIELGEIEAAALNVPGVDAACCAYQSAAGKITCVYAGQAEEKLLRAQLRQRLPRYMLPDRLMRLSALPVTGNGKIDRVRVRQVVDHAYPVP